MNYADHFSTKKTPQTEQANPAQVPNSAGGYSFALDDWQRLHRFLILGTEGGSYYVKERKLTRDNAYVVLRCLQENGMRTVELIHEISTSVRAPKNDAALFALAMAAKLGDVETRKLAFEAFPEVARTGTHLFQFAEYIQAFGGWGRLTQWAFGQWYNDKSPNDLAFQLAKYRQRNGWTHRDILRLAKPIPVTEAHKQLFGWTVGKSSSGSALISSMQSLESEHDRQKVIEAIFAHGLTREMLPTRWLTFPDVWEALLVKMPATALLRNLGNMSKVGLLKPMSKAAAEIERRLSDPHFYVRGKIHPIAVLSATATYGQGRGVLGRGEWTPVQTVMDVLSEGFKLAFGAVKSADKRTLLALDVSSSMMSGAIGGVVGLSPRVASAAMALVTACTEKVWQAMAFCDRFVPFRMSAKDSLLTVMQRMNSCSFGGTDCGLPMTWAESQRIEVDTFVVYTDSETYAGRVHPHQALASYRQKMGIPARLVVVGMVSTEFTIADPSDPGMLDVVGFDTATPNVLSAFSRGEF